MPLLPDTLPPVREYFAQFYMSASFVGAGILSNIAQKYHPFARTFWFAVNDNSNFRSAI